MRDQPAPPKPIRRGNDRAERIGACCAAACLVAGWCLVPHLLNAQQDGAYSVEHDDRSVMRGARSLLAEHCYQKSQAYFHSGAWFSIFGHEARMASETTPTVVLEDGTLPEDETWRCETPFAGRELDWLDGFGRNFMPLKHTHLTSGGASGEGGNLVHEMLPWLELTVRFDSRHITAYEEADYWLRKQMRRPDESEGFLLRGLVENPDNHRLLFLLGQIADQHHADTALARRRWNRALRNWEDTNRAVKEPDIESFHRIASHLASLEEREGNLTVARGLVQRLRAATTRPEAMDRWLAEIDSAQSLAHAVD